MGRYIQPIIVILLALAPWCPTAEVPSLADGIDPIRLLTGDPQQLAAALGGGIELQAAIAAAAADAPVLETQLAERADGQKVFDTHGIPDLRFTAHDLSNQAEGGAQRRSRSPSASSGEDAARTRSAATCKLPATQYATAVNGVQFILHGIRIGIPGVSNAEVIVVSMSDTLSVLRNQYKANGYVWYTPTIGKLGVKIVRYSTLTGSVSWEAGTGDVGFVDGNAENARFSDRVTGVSIQPTCLLGETFSSWLVEGITCPSPGRPGIAASQRFVYVADAGNCAVRLVDSNTGAVSTKWGQTGCPGTPAATAYVDSIYASKVVLSNKFMVSWVGWKFLIVLDEGANRIRKFVTSRHQGLSVLAGGSTNACNAAVTQVDGDGAVATFCRPVAIAVYSDMSKAVVSEITDLNNINVGRLRLLNFTYTYSDGGDVKDVGCVVTTITTNVYTSGRSPDYLWLTRGGMLSTPDGMGSLAVGSFTGKDQIKWDTTQTGSEDYTAAIVSPNGEAKVLVDGAGAHLTGRTLMDIVVSPNDNTTLQLTVAHHTMVPFSEAGYSFAINFKVPTSTIQFLTIKASDVNTSCLTAGLAPATPARRQRTPSAGVQSQAAGDVRWVGVKEQDGAVRLIDVSRLLSELDSRRGDDAEILA